MSLNHDAFARQYGPWGLVAGASEGVGETFAYALAERSLNVVLVARRREKLDAVAESIRERYGVEVRVLPMDLTATDAMAHIAEQTSDIEVGMVMYCAGADPAPAPFLTRSVDSALSLVQRNCLTALQMSHHFGGAMTGRGRGGIVLVSSAAGLRGSANMVAYSASKAFDLVLGESLWVELSPEGVDVLTLVLSRTDTPGFRRLMLAQGAIDSLDQPAPGATSVEDTVALALENLDKGPTYLVGEQLQKSNARFASMSRNEAVRIMATHTRSLHTQK